MKYKKEHEATEAKFEKNQLSSWDLTVFHVLARFAFTEILASYPPPKE